MDKDIPKDSPHFPRHSPLPATILGLSIVLATFIIAVTMAQTRQNLPSSKTISTTGNAERMVSADTIKWTAAIMKTVDSASIKKGTDKLKNDIQSVEVYLENQGFPSEMLDFQPITMSPLCGDAAYLVYGTTTGQPQGCSDGKTPKYSITQTIVITSNDIAKVSQLAQEAPATLIDQGILFTGQNFEYTYSKLDDLKAALTMEATRNAATNAKSIADAVGVTLGGVDSIAADPFQVTPANSSSTFEGSASMPQDTTSLEKKVTVSVHATFRVQ